MKHYLLQEDLIRKENRYVELVDVLDRLDTPYSLHKVVPFIGKVIPPPESDLPIIPFGYYSLRHTSLENGWVFFDLANDDFLVQKEHWGKHMLNYDANIVKFGEIDPWDIQFLRPIDDSKSFSGRVFTKEDVLDFQKGLKGEQSTEFEGLSNDTLVMQSKTKEIYAEYRNWIIDGKVVTSSQYKLGDKVIYKNVDNEEKEMIDFCYGLISDIGIGYSTSQNAFCLDVCKTPNGFKVVEINTINSSGFYGADLQKIVMGLNDTRV